MTKFDYSLGPRPVVVFALLFTAALGASPAAAQSQPLKTAALESHEGLTVSAQPWTDGRQYKEKFSKKTPFAAGVMAIQVAFRNDSDESLKVNLSRIRLTVHLDADNTQELPSLTADEVADAVLKPGSKDPTATRKLPIPVPLPKGNKDKKWTELQQEAQNAGIPSNVVAPHSTVQGLLYFDLQNQFDLLNAAKLYVPEVMQMTGNHGLTYFEIDLGQSGR